MTKRKARSTSESDSAAIFDMETNGLLYEATAIHCIVIEYGGVLTNYYDGPAIPKYTKHGSITDGIYQLFHHASKGDLVVGHNVLGYDFPLLERLGTSYGIFDPFVSDRVYDSYVLSCLMNPNHLPGLDAWGRDFGIKKPPISDWSKLDGDVLHRCREDVKINRKLFDYQVKKGSLTSTWERSRILEQKVLWIHAHQVLHGMRVDILRAQKLVVELDAKIADLEKALHKKLPMTVVQQGASVSKPFKINGTLSKMVTDWTDSTAVTYMSTHLYPLDEYAFKEPHKVQRVGGPFSRIHFEPVNLNSHPRVKELLLSLGWEPTEYNKKKEEDGTWTTMSPKLTEDSYSSLPPGLGQEMATYLSLVHRRRFILNDDPSKALLGHVRKDTGRVPCDAFTCGTNTGRYRHTGGFVNLPKVSTLYGPEIRSLFCVPIDRWLIGIDLDGIEARTMGHYTTFYDGGAFRDEVLKGDIHSKNAKALGVDRETAKTFYYAINYGAGKVKLAKILGCSLSVANKKIIAYWIENIGLSKVIDALKTEYASTGSITGLDGRRLDVRGEHKLLNTLIQNAATVIFKEWMCRCWEYTNAGVPSWYTVSQVLAYHDELGWEVSGCKSKGEALTLGNVLAKLATQTGRHFKLNVTVTAAAQVGRRYSEVH